MKMCNLLKQKQHEKIHPFIRLISVAYPKNYTDPRRRFTHQGWQRPGSDLAVRNSEEQQIFG